MAVLDAVLTLTVPLLILLHLYWAPFTKVEESFNIQAIHDILISGIPSRNTTEYFHDNYDHFTFPGAVPRTFVGALLLAGFSRPFVPWLSSPRQLQILVRAVLGLFNACAILSFRTAVSKLFGRVAGNWFILLQVTQFHVIYYASRTLPNMFAFGITTIALREVLMSFAAQGKSEEAARHRRLSLYLLTVAGVIFRSEIAILLIMLTFYLFFRKHASLFKEVISAGGAGAIVGLMTTVLVDSFFWQKLPLWPEWVGFYYNTVQGKSADWGTSPWNFYIVNAIPRLLMNPMSWLVCIPVALRMGATRNSSLDISAPLIAYVAAYSLLPHKEWRFIVYVVPGLTAIAAAGAGYIWNRRGKSTVYRFLALGLVASTVASLIASCGLLALSSLNYPGAASLLRLHSIADGSKGIINVHLDVLSCQTGVTRFLQKPRGRSLFDPGTVWFYDKTEDDQALLNPAFWQTFDYALMEKPEKAIGKWEIVDQIDGFAGVGISKLDHDSSATTTAVSLSQCWKAHGSAPRLSCYYGLLSRVVRKHVTRGWWPVIKMQPKIRILKRQET